MPNPLLPIVGSAIGVSGGIVIAEKTLMSPKAIVYSMLKLLRAVTSSLQVVSELLVQQQVLFAL